MRIPRTEKAVSWGRTKWRHAAHAAVEWLHDVRNRLGHIGLPCSLRIPNISFLMVTSTLFMGQALLTQLSPRLAWLAVIPGTIGLWWLSSRHTKQLQAEDQKQQEQQTGRSAEWQQWVGPYRSGLGMLRTQLVETAQQVEQAVVSVCASFSDIALRAQEGVRQSQQSLNAADTVNGDTTDQRAELNELIQTTRLTLKELAERLTQSSTISTRAVEKIEDMKAGMDRVLQSVQEIDKIAHRTRMIALNTTIEAARVGDEGKGFVVVANETTSLAAKTVQAAEVIKRVTEQVRASVAGAYSELQTLATKDMSETVRLHEQVEQTISALQAGNTELSQVAQEATRKSQALAQDISAVIVSMQFQDAVNQRVLHVTEALEGLEQRLVVGPTVVADGTDWLAQIEQSYTMEAERQVGVHPSQDGDQQPGHSTPAETSVELF